MFISELLRETSNDTIVQTPTGYSTESDDQSVLKLSDMRKTRLTLGQLNKLRVLNDIRKVEFEQKIKTVAAQYQPPASTESGGMM